jgi:muramoyltetrapeptide carboxypeptidase LdcA involved in peptidoglycan recycling
MVKLPARVEAGDTVAVVSPSWGALSRWPHRLERGTAYLESLGLKVKVMPNATKSDRWVAGTPQERADDLNAAFADPDVAVVLAAIGGNHSNQVAPLLDFDIIAEHPKAFVGYSDNTVLHWAIHQRTGLVTFYGPSPLLALAEGGVGEGIHVLEYTDRYLRAALMGDEPIDYDAAPAWTEEFLDFEKKADVGRARHLEPNPGWIVLRGGEARGPLLGGCLETIAWHLKGSEWWLDLEGALLFLETSEEAPPPADVDGYLTDFEQLGVFEAVSGLVVGRPAYYEHDDIEVLHHVLHERTEPAGIPLLANFDCGHTDPMATLPLGAEMHLDTDVGTFSTLAAPTAPRP